jgi:hypothetical protein
MEKAFSVGSAPRLYNDDPRPAEIYLKERLEMVVELLGRDDKNELGCAKTSCVLELQ